MIRVYFLRHGTKWLRTKDFESLTTNIQLLWSYHRVEHVSYKVPVAFVTIRIDWCNNTDKAPLIGQAFWEPFIVMYSLNTEAKVLSWSWNLTDKLNPSIHPNPVSIWWRWLKFPSKPWRPFPLGTGFVDQQSIIKLVTKWCLLRRFLPFKSTTELKFIWPRCSLGKLTQCLWTIGIS